MVELRWIADATEEGIRVPPMLALITRRRWLGVRFGKERHPSFSERYQGTRGIPIIWHHMFGGWLSFTIRPVPDNRPYQRFGNQKFGGWQ